MTDQNTEPDYRARYEEEHLIVSRIWKQLGSPSFDELNGRSIYDLIDELKIKATAASAAAKAREDWQPIETVPQKLTVLATDGKTRWMYNSDTEEKDAEIIARFGFEKRHATHWMPLPEPPIASQSKDSGEGE